MSCNFSFATISTDDQGQIKTFNLYYHNDGGDLTFLISPWPYVTTCLKDHVTLWVEAPHGSYQLVMLGGHWSIASADIAHLIYHVSLWDYVTEESCDFMSGSSLLYVTTLPSFGGHRHEGSGDNVLVIQGKDSTCPRLNPTLLFISKVRGMSCFHTWIFGT